MELIFIPFQLLVSIPYILYIFCLLSILETNVWMNHTNYMYMFSNFDKFSKYKETDSPVISVDFPSKSGVLQGKS